MESLIFSHFTEKKTHCESDHLLFKYVFQFTGVQSSMERRRPMYPKFGIQKPLERFQPLLCGFESFLVVPLRRRFPYAIEEVGLTSLLKQPQRGHMRLMRPMSHAGQS